MNYYPGVTLDEQHSSFRKQYLEQKGWDLSFVERTSRDLHGPVPWFTYPALAFLDKMIKTSDRIFEFGGGSSTAWFCARCCEVMTIEHDIEWSTRLQERGFRNATIKAIPIDAPLDAGSHRAIAAFFDLHHDPDVTDTTAREFRAGLINKRFQAYAASLLSVGNGYDVVVIDGMARNLCAWIIAQSQSPAPVVVFDNSDRPDYADGYKYLLGAGYRPIDFWGPGPMNPYEWCTTLFIRSLKSLPTR